MKMPRNAAVYVRISRDREGAGLGVARQEADCRELAGRLGWTVTEVYTDNDISAYSGKSRPAYKAMLDDLRGGRANAVIAWHPDRLHRRVAELEGFVTVCEDHDVAIQTVRAGEIDLATASGRMIARMLGAAAQHEIDHSRERIQRAKGQAAADGHYRGGRRPFGFRADGVTIEPHEAVALDRAAGAILAGRSLGAVSRELNESGFTTTAGKPFKPDGLRRTLLKARNAGLIERNGEPVGPAIWPAIIEEPKWLAVRALLMNPDRRTTTGPERRWLGSGLYLCGVCGAVCRTTIGNRQRIYTCLASKCVARRVDQVDKVVLGMIAARLGRADLAALLRGSGGGVDMAGLQGAATALRVRLDELAELFAAGDITAAQLRTGSDRLRSDLKVAETAVAAAASGGVLNSLAADKNPSQSFLNAPLDKQRAVIDALAVVTIKPTTRGRPAGWKRGQPYFSPETVDVAFK